MNSLSSLHGSFSKGPVKKGIIDDNCMGFDIEICPDLLLAGLALAAAGAFLAIYTAITGMGRKKKRSIDDANGRPEVPFADRVGDLYWIGRVALAF